LRADLIILDDPITDKAAAESEASRTTLSNYYHSDLMSRLKPDGKVVLIATPLHERDLMGELLCEEPDEWHVLPMPAFAEADDALGRQEGEPLWRSGTPVSLNELAAGITEPDMPRDPFGPVGGMGIVRASVLPVPDRRSCRGYDGDLARIARRYGLYRRHLYSISRGGDVHCSITAEQPSEGPGAQRLLHLLLGDCRATRSIVRSSAATSSANDVSGSGAATNRPELSR
jgi:hypothetical protein